MRSLAIAATLASTSIAHADGPPKENREEAGLYLGGFIASRYHQFYDEMKFSAETRPELARLSPELGLRYAYFLHKNVGVEGEGGMILAKTKNTDDTANIYELRLQVIIQHPGRVTPYVGIGAALAHVSSNVLGSDTDFPIHIGIGARYFATSAIALRFDARLLRGPSSNSPYTLNATYGELGIGVSWVPNTPAPVARREAPVDPDPDHDGILGLADRCPSEPGPGTSDGCPVRDKDGDGIVDAADKCPDQAETVNGYQDDDGCPDQIPDTDGDGINDLVDRCPKEPEDKDGYQDEDGCPDPDNDGDGVPDDKDRCRDVAGTADNQGCPDPDTDKDGVVDRLDSCPSVAGRFHGCPKAIKAVLGQTQVELSQQLVFLPGARLWSESKPVLDDVARVLAAHPELKLRVEAHTDNVGKPEKNLVVSKDRANAVVAYLVSKGIAAARLQAAGYGDTVPIATNATPKGRERNRRVELVIVRE
jgi:outer membrane protein OmpA-like peptidoglycan-associated protein